MHPQLVLPVWSHVFVSLGVVAACYAPHVRLRSNGLNQYYPAGVASAPEHVTLPSTHANVLIIIFGFHGTYLCACPSSGMLLLLGRPDSVHLPCQYHLSTNSKRVDGLSHSRPKGCMQHAARYVKPWSGRVPSKSYPPLCAINAPLPLLRPSEEARKPLGIVVHGEGFSALNLVCSWPHIQQAEI